MGVILSGILGGFSGKVGPVVGGKWKDVDYMRSYVIPANPNTLAQQTQRTRFAVVVENAKALLTGLLQPYWDYYFSNMSGFNAFVSRAVKLDIGETQILAGTPASVGTLEPVYSAACVYTTGSGNCAFTWDDSIFGNGQNTDKMLLLVYNKNTKQILGMDDADTRVGGGGLVVVDTGLDETNLLFACFPYRGSGGTFTTAESVFADVAAA